VAKTLTPENIGTALGQLANKIDSWKRQRDVLIAEGERLADVALGFVRDLRGHSTAARPGSARKGGRPKGMKMSEETKAKLRAAWKVRKARAQAEATKTGDVRAQVRAKSGRRPSARASKRSPN